MSVGEFFESMEENRAVLGFMMRSSSSDFIDTAARRQRQLPPCSVNHSSRLATLCVSNVCSSHPSTAGTALCRDTNEHRNIKLHYTFSHAHSIINSIRISFEVFLSRSLIFYSPDMLTGMAPTSPLTHTQPQDSIFFLYLIYSQPYLEFTFINTTILWGTRNL